MFQEMNFTKIFIFILFIFISIITTTFIKAKNKEEVKRKIPHILIGIVFSISPIFMTKKEIILSASILFLGVLVSKKTNLFRNIFSINRITYGLWVTPLSLGIMSFLWLPENIKTFIFGFLIMTFSDAFASLIGKKWGKKKWFLLQKSFLGSFVFFLITFLISYLFMGKVSIWKLLLSSTFLTIVEIISIWGFDNLTIPIISSIIFNILN